jgi:hypothetical protein
VAGAGVALGVCFFEDLCFFVVWVVEEVAAFVGAGVGAGVDCAKATAGRAAITARDEMRNRAFFISTSPFRCGPHARAILTRARLEAGE